MLCRFFFNIFIYRRCRYRRLVDCRVSCRPAAVITIERTPASPSPPIPSRDTALILCRLFHFSFSFFTPRFFSFIIAIFFLDGRRRLFHVSITPSRFSSMSDEMELPAAYRATIPVSCAFTSFILFFTISGFIYYNPDGIFHRSFHQTRSPVIRGCLLCRRLPSLNNNGRFHAYHHHHHQ